jgi:hypothetical protein
MDHLAADYTAAAAAGHGRDSSMPPHHLLLQALLRQILQMAGRGDVLQALLAGAPL